MSLEESLRALAADDDARVPHHVDAAVMAAWAEFADRPAVARRRRAMARPRRTTMWNRMGKALRRAAMWQHMTMGDRVRPWPIWVAACAGLVIAAVLLTSSTSRENAGRPTAASPAALIQDELVLVPEFEGAGPLTLMRVRMTRREFSRLGVPISNPEGEGLIDVEVLVGEDGVARSIRRAVAVSWTGPNP